MKRRLTLAFLILALASGALAGTPLHSENMAGSSMKCCKKMKGGEQKPATSLARLHCAIYCGDSSPVPGGSSSNFAPPRINITESIITEIARFLASEENINSPPVISSERVILPRRIPPKYIQHHSFLI